LAACLPHGLDDLGHTAAIARMVRAEPATICVEGQLADAGNQITVGNELTARALLAETEILDLDDHSDCEAVVDRCVLDVGRLHPRHLECGLAGLEAARIGKVKPDTPTLDLVRLSDADDLHFRALEALCNFRAGNHQRTTPVGDHATVEPMQRVGYHR